MNHSTSEEYAGERAAWPAQRVGRPLKWAEIDVSALQNNVTHVARRVGSAQVMAMVKANGYGHGALLVAAAAQTGGATWLGVSSADEAMQLRDGGVTLPILITGWSHPSALSSLIAADVDITVDSAEMVRRVGAAAAQVAAVARVQIKLETGMNRLGAPAETLPALHDALRDTAESVRVTGIFTHFADADGASLQPTVEQHSRFLELLQPFKAEAPDALVHCCNSAALLRFPDFHHDLVRPGLLLYGYVPPNCGAADVTPAMNVFSLITSVKTVLAGGAVGYGRTWQASQDRRIATVAAGYADGIMRVESNRGSALVNGVRCPIVGRISMDQLTLDVSDVPDVAVGQQTLLMGKSGSERLTADEVGEAAGTIAYEVMCAISARVPRVIKAS